MSKPDLIAEAITEALGERCTEFETGCFCCEAWREYDDLRTKPDNGWRPIETAPKDGTHVIIAIPTKNRDDFYVGEAYFDADHPDGGDWWWAGTDWSDYHAGPVSEVNFHGPTHWQPLPKLPVTP